MTSIKDLKGPKPDPYFAARVLAEHRARTQTRRLNYWRIFSALTVGVVFVLSFQLWRNSRNSVPLNYAMAPVHKSMVLQLDAVPENKNIAFITLEIDEGMVFDIAAPEHQGKKELTVAVDQLEGGSRRLPFVFKALSAGKKNIKVKFLDSDFNVVKEDLHLLEFYENQKKENKI